MSHEPNAFERDKRWLAAHGHGDLDAEEFSDWVCRVMADGMKEIDARFFVLEQLLMKQTGDDTAKAGPLRAGIV